MESEVVDQLARVELLLDLRRPQEALTLAIQAVAASPDDFRCHEVLARCLNDCGSYVEALAAARHAISLEPTAPAPFFTGSRIATTLGRWAEAVSLARECVRLAPHDASAHARLGTALAKNAAGQAAFGVPLAPQLREAHRQAGEALRLAPQTASAHFAAGYVAMATRKKGQARRHFRNALALDPHHTSSHHNLAVLDRQGMRLARSSAGFARVLRLDPSQQLARANVLITLYAQLIALHALAWAGYLLFMLHNATLPLVPYRTSWTLRCTVALGLLVALALLVTVVYRRADPGVRRMARTLAAGQRRLWVLIAVDSAMLGAFWVGTIGIGRTAEDAYLLGLTGTVAAAGPLMSLVAAARRQQQH